MKQLPPELQLLEDRLAKLASPANNSALRGRVLRAVAVELETHRQPSTIAGDPWRWLAIAASVLVVVNASMISANRDEFSSGQTAHADSIAAEIRVLQTLEQNGNLK